MARRKKLGILISGRGSNMAALVEASRAIDCPYEVALVASDKPEASGLAWARERMACRPSPSRPRDAQGRI
jgi:phosphoribosylglycinamide formyltransferase-1